MATHIAKLEDLAHRLTLMGEAITDNMMITKILLTLPAGYDYFVSAWESTPLTERSKANLISRLAMEELRQKQRDDHQQNALVSQKQKRRGGKYQGKAKNSQKPGKCFKCDRPGHWTRDCRSNTQKAESGKNESKGEGLVSEALASIQQSKDVVQDKWYLDSGATDHMTHRRNGLCHTGH